MLKNFRIILAAAGLTALLSGCTINKPEEQVRTITVSGSGSAVIDTQKSLVLDFYLRNIEWNASLAIQRNAEATQRTREALKAIGISSADITTENYTVSQDNTQSYPGRYTVQNTLVVKLRDESRINEVIDAAVAYSINTPNTNKAGGLTDFKYKVTEGDKTSALREARTEAVKNAQNAANLIAGATGCKTNSVLDIKETGCYTTTTAEAKTRTYAASAVTDADEETLSVVSEVTITYSLMD